MMAKPSPPNNQLLQTEKNIQNLKNKTKKMRTKLQVQKQIRTPVFHSWSAQMRDTCALDRRKLLTINYGGIGHVFGVVLGWYWVVLGGIGADLMPGRWRGRSVLN